MATKQVLSLLITNSDNHWTQLWVPGEEKPRRLFSSQSVARGCLSLCRLYPGYHFTCKTSSINCVEASPCSFEFFSLDKETPEHKCSAPEGLVIFKYSCSGRYLLGGDVFGRMYIWEVSSGVLLCVWDAHWRSLSDICFADDGVVFVTASEDGTLKSWSLLQVTRLSLCTVEDNRKLSPLSIFRGHTMPVTHICCGRYSLRDWIFSCSLDCTVRVWKLSSGEWLHTYSFVSPLTCLTMHHDEAILFVGTEDGQIYQIWIYLPLQNNTHCCCPIQLREHSTHRVTCLRWIPQYGQERLGLLLSASEDQNIYVYDYGKHEMIQMYNKMLGKVSNIEIVEQETSYPTTMIDTHRWNIRLKRVALSLESASELKSIWACYEPRKNAKYPEEKAFLEWRMKLTKNDTHDQTKAKLFQYYDRSIYERLWND
ncbi:hypothetical protein GpartN1_g7426.t1 [Galdieria partita]|uniref:Uncharacterized protein n=1 Tax=Galdieria partita TaxID=83374 RepID=A0A9C7Q403_9RHOD|nr:hypothetical protein GpartN1_g7426.t1 [Galdieria partita]